jgi:hypothetical protein
MEQESHDGPNIAQLNSDPMAIILANLVKTHQLLIHS